MKHHSASGDYRCGSEMPRYTQENNTKFVYDRGQKVNVNWRNPERGDESSLRYGRHKNRHGEDRTFLTVNSDKVGKIIGRQGAKIKELQSSTGTHISIGNENSDGKVRIAIAGDATSREKCKEMIEKEIEMGSQRIFERTSVETKEDSFPVIDWDALNKISDDYEKKRWEKCPPLKKNFYMEDPLVAAMDDDYVQLLRKSMNNITVSNTFDSNQKIPNPVETFEQAFYNYPEIMEEIIKQNFTKPFPIQCQAWPILLSGKDMIGIAQTGTGKTLAFLLPALIHTDGQEMPLSERGGPNVLILAPTRELAIQIEKEVEKYSYRDIKSLCVYGGCNRQQQIKNVRKGVQIIIATPGRLNDLVEAGVININSVTYVVLDEADRMLDMGFEPQIRKVLLDIRPDKQIIMTSATWPYGVQNLAKKYMCDPIQVVVGSLDLAAVHSVKQTILIVEEEDKNSHLLDFIYNLTEDDKVMIFVDKKILADSLSCDLTLQNIECQCIHGNRDQSDREQAIEDLKSGYVKILIATDVASRGIDITDVTKVLNYDFPRNIEEYVHRVGRTGRAGKTGEAITFFTRKDWAYAKELIAILQEADQEIPNELYGMRDRYEARLEKRKNESSFGRHSHSSSFGGYRGTESHYKARSQSRGTKW